jgi:hypothetical protein
MKGIYRFYDGDDLIAECPNILTNSGRIAIGRYLSGERGSWGDALAVGSGDSTPLATDTALEMEFWREEVDLKKYNGPGAIPPNQLVLRSIIPARIAGVIKELGVYCTVTPDYILAAGPTIAIFDTSIESWVGGEDEEFDYRIGTKSLKVEGGSSASVKYYGDLRAFTENTKFRLAYYSVGSVTNVKIRFASNLSNFKEYSFEPENTGNYTVELWELGDFAQTGNPDWKEVFFIEVEVEGSGHVVFDAITSTEQRPNDVLSVLVSRALVNANGEDFIEKLPTRELQIEYLVGISL